MGEGNGLKRQGLALLGGPTRARIERFLHRRAATAAARRTGTSNTYILETNPTRHALTLRPFAPMSHSPAPPPQLSNNINNNNNTHSNTSPSQLAHILSTVLADNETLSKDLTVARARYERAEQTLALLKPPHTSAAAAADAPSPPSAYPEPAVRTIMDLQSQLEIEKVAREAAESRLRTISDAWFEFNRYLQTSEVHLSDARSHFSQVLRDPSTKPSFNPHPAYQPHRSHHSAPRASVATSQTFTQSSASANLPARVRHRDDNTEEAPPPKRIRTDRGTRRPIEVRICHTPIACNVLIPAA